MHYKDAVFLTPTSWNHNVCEMLQRSKKVFSRPAHSAQIKVGKSVLIMKENLW